MDSNYGSPPPPQGGDPSMSGLSSPQGLDMSDLSSAVPLVSTMSGVSSSRPPALVPTAFVDYTAQTGHTNGADWQEEVYQKIKVMKEIYYPELSEMYQKIAAKLQQHDSLPQQPKSDQLDKLKMFKTMLERLITVLQVSKTNISPGLKDKLGLYEKQIINFINTNRPRKPVSSLQQGQLPPPHMHSMQQSQSQITQVQSHENQMNPQLQSMNLQGSVPTMQQNNMTGMQLGLDMAHLSSAPPLVSTMSGVSSAQPPALVPTAFVVYTAQTGHTNGADWQEEVYQKIKVMKEIYYPELSEMYQKIAAKLQQHDSLPQQPKSDQLEKLKMFETMLERLITVLQVSKTNISPGLKDKLGLYEKQIINFINTNRPRKPVSSLQQGQLPPPHMHSMQQSQSQITQVQSLENQMNPQLQSMNLQGSVSTMQQNNMTGMQQGLDMSHLSSAPPLVSTMSGVSSAQPPALVPTAFVDYTAQTGHTNGADWQEEVYQKIKVMKEMYYPELSEMYQKIAAKLQQHDSLPQQPKSDQLEKLKMFKTMLERLITVIQVSKTNVSPGLKDKLGLYEKQIINFINTNRPRRPVSSLQQGQLPPPHMHSMQ